MLKDNRKVKGARFQCPVEGDEFDTFADLQAHYMPRHARGMKTISAEKFICPYDGLEFDTLEALKIHVYGEASAGSRSG